MSAKALAFTILTAARSGEVRGAITSEIDGCVWTVPAERMKSEREHRVPLVAEAVSALKEVESLQTEGGFVFPGYRSGRPLSDATLRRPLQSDMGYSALVVHGFRSTFRDWAAECTSYPRELAEAALAHVLESKVEAAYLRGDMFERRRELMEAWASYLVSSSASVVALQSAGLRRG